MTNLNQILSEIRDLSPADLQELKVYLQAAVPESKMHTADQPAPAARPATLEFDAEFDADLNAVTFAAASLPASFTRADIYDDHD